MRCHSVILAVLALVAAIGHAAQLSSQHAAFMAKKSNLMRREKPLKQKKVAPSEKSVNEENGGHRDMKEDELLEELEDERQEEVTATTAGPTPSPEEDWKEDPVEKTFSGPIVIPGWPDVPVSYPRRRFTAQDFRRRTTVDQWHRVYTSVPGAFPWTGAENVIWDHGTWVHDAPRRRIPGPAQEGGPDMINYQDDNPGLGHRRRWAQGQGWESGPRRRIKSPHYNPSNIQQPDMTLPDRRRRQDLADCGPSRRRNGDSRDERLLCCYRCRAPTVQDPADNRLERCTVNALGTAG